MGLLSVVLTHPGCLGWACNQSVMAYVPPLSLVQRVKAVVLRA